MLTTSEVTRIARSVVAIRPDWQLNDIYTFIDHRLRDKDFHAVAVASAWVAADPLTKKFVRIESSGPWWNLIGQPTLLASVEIPDHERCVTCNRHQDSCDGQSTRTHQFQSVTEWKQQSESAKNDPSAERRKQESIAKMREAAKSGARNNQSAQAQEV